MNKLPLVLGALGIVIITLVAATASFFEPCKEPLPQVAELITQQCLLQLDINKEREAICEGLGRGSQCELSPDKDFNALQKHLVNAIAPCFKKVLKVQNLCTDVVDRMIDEAN